VRGSIAEVETSLGMGGVWSTKMIPDKVDGCGSIVGEEKVW
jgi:hypothetical protein